MNFPVEIEEISCNAFPKHENKNSKKYQKKDIQHCFINSFQHFQTLLLFLSLHNF